MNKKKIPKKVLNMKEVKMEIKIKKGITGFERCHTERRKRGGGQRRLVVRRPT